MEDVATTGLDHCSRRVSWHADFLHDTVFEDRLLLGLSSVGLNALFKLGLELHQIIIIVIITLLLTRVKFELWVVFWRLFKRFSDLIVVDIGL